METWRSGEQTQEWITQTNDESREPTDDLTSWESLDWTENEDARVWEGNPVTQDWGTKKVKTDWRRTDSQKAISYWRYQKKVRSESNLWSQEDIWHHSIRKRTRKSQSEWKNELIRLREAKTGTGYWKRKRRKRKIGRIWKTKGNPLENCPRQERPIGEHLASGRNAEETHPERE